MNNGILHSALLGASLPFFTSRFVNFFSSLISHVYSVTVQQKSLHQTYQHSNSLCLMGVRVGNLLCTSILIHSTGVLEKTN